MEIALYSNVFLYFSPRFLKTLTDSQDMPYSYRVPVRISVPTSMVFCRLFWKIIFLIKVKPILQESAMNHDLILNVEKI